MAHFRDEFKNAVDNVVAAWKRWLGNTLNLPHINTWTVTWIEEYDAVDNAETGLAMLQVLEALVRTEKLTIIPGTPTNARPVIVYRLLVTQFHTKQAPSTLQPPSDTWGII
jgi:hypothetical protein